MFNNSSFTGIGGFFPHQAHQTHQTHQTHKAFPHGVRFSGQTRQVDPEGILNRHIFQRVNHLRPNNEAAPLHERPQGETAAEKIAGRVLAFIGRSVGNISDARQYQQKLDEAAQGIDQGIDDARRTLERLGLGSDEIDQMIEQTRTLLSEGLESLRQNAPGAETAPTSAAVVTQSSYSQSSRSRESFSLTVETLDGDRVTLDIVNQQGQSLDYQNTSSEDGVIVQLSAGSISAGSLQFSVQGELDDGEMAALHGLMQDVSQLSNEFFQGDIDQAMKQALSLGFDTQQLAGFSLDLKQTQVVTVAETYYQSSAPIADGGSDTSEPSRFDLPRFSDFVQLLRGIEQQQESSLPFGQSLQLFHDLFKQAVNHDQRFAEADSERQEDIHNSLTNLLDE